MKEEDKEILNFIEKEFEKGNWNYALFRLVELGFLKKKVWDYFNREEVR
jgi:hypothetical protein